MALALGGSLGRGRHNGHHSRRYYQCDGRCWSEYAEVSGSFLRIAANEGEESHYARVDVLPMST